MIVIALILLIFDIVMLYCMAFGIVNYFTQWFGQQFLEYCVYVMGGSVPVIWLCFLCEPYPVAISNGKEIAKDLADELDKRDKREGK